MPPSFFVTCAIKYGIVTFSASQTSSRQRSIRFSLFLFAGVRGLPTSRTLRGRPRFLGRELLPKLRCFRSKNIKNCRYIKICRTLIRSRRVCSALGRIHAANGRSLEVIRTRNVLLLFCILTGIMRKQQNNEASYLQDGRRLALVDNRAREYIQLRRHKALDRAI